MFNKNDPLIGAVQQVMQSSNAERAAAKAVNEKFGVVDRKALPREKQPEWDAAYKQILSEELKGNQHKIDANKNGKVDGGDFKLLKKGVRPMEEEGDPSKAIRGDDVTGGSSVTTVKSKEKTITPADQSALKKKIQSIKEDEQIEEESLSAKAAAAGKDIGKPGKNFAKIAASAGKKYGSAEAGKRVAGAVLAKMRAKNMQEATGYSGGGTVGRADAITQGRQKQQAAAVTASVQKQNAIQRTNVGPGAITGGTLGKQSGSGTTDISGPASRLSRGKSPSAAGDAKGGARPAAPAPSVAGGARPAVVAKNSASGTQSSTGTMVGGARPAIVAKNSPSNIQKSTGLAIGGARPGAPGKNTPSGSQKSTGAQIGGARPEVVAKNAPTAKAPVPKPKPTGNANVAKPGKKVVPVKKQPPAASAKRPNVAPKPVKKAAPRNRLQSKTQRDSEVGPGN